MHETAINSEQALAIGEAIEVFGRVENARGAATVGRHPALGSCIMMQLPDRTGVLLSEFALPSPSDRSRHARSRDARSAPIGSI